MEFTFQSCTGKIVLAIVGVVWYKKHMELISQKF